MPVGLAELQIDMKMEKIMERVPNKIKNKNHISVKEFKYIIGVIYSVILVSKRDSSISEEEIINLVAQKLVNNIGKINFLYHQKLKLNLDRNEYLFSLIHFFKNIAV